MPKLLRPQQSTEPINTDPKLVFQMVGVMVGVLSAVFLGAVALWKGREVGWPLVAGMAIPSVAILLVVSDGFRRVLLKVADRLPFVNFSKTKGGDGDSG